jgi:hypothetical protein
LGQKRGSFYWENFLVNKWEFDKNSSSGVVASPTLAAPDMKRACFEKENERINQERIDATNTYHQ